MVMLTVLRSSARRASVRLCVRSSHAALVHPFALPSSSSSSTGLRPGALSISLQSRRLLSTAAPEDDAAKADSAVPRREPELVYAGPMARAVRLMKGVSVTSCILTSVGMPTLCLISEQSASMVGKWAMCGTIMLFGLGTTSLFHVLFKPYVMRMWRSDDDAADPELTVETVTLFAQLTRHSFKLSDVAPPPPSMHPMLSFQAKGKSLFVHLEEFEDRALAEQLIGKKLAPQGDHDDDEQ